VVKSPYSIPVVKAAYAASRIVLLAPPRQARNFLRSIQSRAKTDKLDSRGLALFALSQPLSAYPIKTPMQEQLDQLLSARKGLSRAAATLGQQRDELPHAAQALTCAIAELNAQVKEMDRQIAALTAGAPEMQAAQSLAKVPGIGKVTAAALASRLSGNRFSHPDKLVAYLGLDVGVQQSGKRRGERGLTKQGDAELRRLLFLCASASLRAKDPVFKDQYEREKAKGLPTTAALCAVARKMAKVCWSIARYGTDYDPARVRQQIPQPKNLAAPLDKEP
jgi:transposase